MITTEGLTKRYPGGKGIEDLTFTVEQGEVFGFLGPNGAGKTTTLRILMGFIRPDQGTARIKGMETLQKSTRLKRIVGYLPGELHFFDKLTGRDLLDLLAGMHGGGRAIKHRCEALIQRFDLSVDQKIHRMSKGMKQKLGIIAAFMPGAEVLLLDEPTSGLDPLMQKIFIELIREEQKKGATILMSSHQFAEIEKTCRRVGIIRDGTLLTVENIASLRQKQCRTFDIQAANEEAAAILRESQLSVIEQPRVDWQEAVQGADREGPWFTVKTSGDLNNLWKVLSQIQITEFHQRTLELEDTFMQFYQ